MTIINSRVFSENPIYYLNLSNNEEVAVKRGKKMYWIKPQEDEVENLSPSGDPYWADPRNIAELKRRDELSAMGKNPIVGTLRTSEDIKALLGLNDDDL